MPNNTKVLTRGKAVIKARDASSPTFTVSVGDGVVTNTSPPIKRSSGQGYDVKLTTPFEGGFTDSARYTTRGSIQSDASVAPSTLYNFSTLYAIEAFPFAKVDQITPTFLPPPTSETSVISTYGSPYLVEYSVTPPDISVWGNALDALGVTVSTWLGAPEFDDVGGTVRLDRTLSQYATFGSTSFWNAPTSTGDFTLGVSLNILSMGAAVNSVFAPIFHSQSTERGIFLGIVDVGTHGTLRFRALDSTGTELYGVGYALPDSVFPKDLDIFIIGNGATVKMYVNEVDVGTDTIAIQAGDHQNVMYLGKSSDAASYLDAEIRGFTLLNTRIPSNSIPEWGAWFRGQIYSPFLGGEYLLLDVLNLDLNNDDPVFRWEDESGYAHDFIRYPSNDPKYISNAGDNFPALVFSTSRMDGPTHLMQNKSAFTIVAYVRALSTDSQQKAILFGTTAGNETNTRLGLFHQNSVLNAAVRRLDADSVKSVSGGDVGVGEWKINAVDVDWQTRTLRLYDGLTVVGTIPDVGGSAGNTTDLPSGAMTLGMTTGTPRYFNGEMRTLVAYDRILSPAEMQSLQERILARYTDRGLAAWEGLTLWLDTDSSTLFTDVAGTSSVAVDGDRIANWSNKIGAGYLADSLTNASVGEQLYYRTAGINGKPAVEFDLGQRLKASSVTNASSSWTVIAVLTMQQVDAFGKYLFDFSNPRLIFQIDYVNTAGDGPAYFDGTHRQSGDANPLNTPMILTWVLNNATGTGKIFRDNYLIANLTYSGVAPSSATLAIGGHHTDAGPFHNGFVGEAGVWARALPDFDVMKVTNALRRKWEFTRTSAELFDPVAWWHADDLDAVHADNDAVGTWPNRIGGGVSISQVTPANQPRWSESKKALTFSQSSPYWMSFDPIAPSLNATGIATIMLTYRQYSVSSQSCIIGTYPASPSADNNGILWFDANPQRWRVYTDVLDAIIVPQQNAPLSVVITWEINTITDTYKLWINHDLRGQNTGTVPNFSDTDRWTLGQDWDGAYPSDYNTMDVYEIAVWDKVLGDNERNASIDRMGQDWGVGV